MPFYSGCIESEGLRCVTRPGRDGIVTLCARDQRLLIVVAGEPLGAPLLECFEAARAEGWLGHSMKTLVDIRGFVGVVDWQAIYHLRQLADWGDDAGLTRTAYLVRNERFEPLVKIAATLFHCCEHKTFTDHDMAVAWLDG